MNLSMDNQGKANLLLRGILYFVKGSMESWKSSYAYMYVDVFEACKLYNLKHSQLKVQSVEDAGITAYECRQLLKRKLSIPHAASGYSTPKLVINNLLKEYDKPDCFS